MGSLTTAFRRQCGEWLPAIRFALVCIFPALCFLLISCMSPYLIVCGWPLVQAIPWNAAFLFLCGAVLFLLTGRLHVALWAILGFSFIYGIADAYIVSFRGRSIAVWDLLSIKTAVSVAGGYDFTPTAAMIASLLVAAVLAAFAGSVHVRIVRHVRVRLIGLLACLLCFIGYFHCIWMDDFYERFYLYSTDFYEASMAAYNGQILTFLVNLQYLSINEPEGYDIDEAEALLAEYETDTDTEVLPNIIVVMNESFSDLSVIADLETEMDYMPYMHSLQAGNEDTITGYVNVSVYGGNTPNSEFEFLTGNTMAFLPEGSIPYQQYLEESTPSLVSQLSDLGYDTIAMHPYYETGWHRDTVYPLLGFDETYFIDDFEDAELVRNYVSDAAVMDKIEEAYENKGDDLLFIFAVTMQNHGGYDTDNGTMDIDTYVEGAGDPLNTYLSLIKKSDEALEDLIAYFSDTEEPTVIIWFGDHQPRTSISGLAGEDAYLQYLTPYVIWANYDIPEETGLDTSLNYLAAIALDAAGVPLSAYQNFLLELRKSVPVISAVRQVGENEEMLAEYEKLQYYRLFDWNG